MEGFGINENFSIPCFEENKMMPMHRENTVKEIIKPMSLDESIEMYKKVGHRNADFLFKWINSVYDFFYLPSVDLKMKKTLMRDKTKLTIFDVLIDDLADNAEIRDREVLEEAIGIAWNGLKSTDNDYLKVTKKIWDDCIESIKNYPRFEEFKDLFYFDLEKVMHSMKYSFLANDLGINNGHEDEINLAHGCMVILHADMDLMCSPTFDKKELKKIRPILYWVEDIVHIGNLMNTYAREVEEADFSSPMISLALDRGIVDKEIIINNPEEAIKKISILVPYFKERVENNFKKIEEVAKTIESIDMEEFLKKLMKVWEGFNSRVQYWKTD